MKNGTFVLSEERYKELVALAGDQIRTVVFSGDDEEKKNYRVDNLLPGKYTIVMSYPAGDENGTYYHIAYDADVTEDGDITPDPVEVRENNIEDTIVNFELIDFTFRHERQINVGFMDERSVSSSIPSEFLKGQWVLESIGNAIGGELIVVEPRGSGSKSKRGRIDIRINEKFFTDLGLKSVEEIPQYFSLWFPHTKVAWGGDRFSVVKEGNELIVKLLGDNEFDVGYRDRMPYLTKLQLKPYVEEDVDGIHTMRFFLAPNTQFKLVFVGDEDEYKKTFYDTRVRKGFTATPVNIDGAVFELGVRDYQVILYGIAEASEDDIIRGEILPAGIWPFGINASGGPKPVYFSMRLGNSSETLKARLQDGNEFGYSSDSRKLNFRFAYAIDGYYEGGIDTAEYRRILRDGLLRQLGYKWEELISYAPWVLYEGKEYLGNESGEFKAPFFVGITGKFYNPLFPSDDIAKVTPNHSICVLLTTPLRTDKDSEKGKPEHIVYGVEYGVVPMHRITFSFRANRPDTDAIVRAMVKWYEFQILVSEYEDGNEIKEEEIVPIMFRVKNAETIDAAMSMPFMEAKRGGKLCASAQKDNDQGIYMYLLPPRFIEDGGSVTYKISLKVKDKQFSEYKNGVKTGKLAVTHSKLTLKQIEEILGVALTANDPISVVGGITLKSRDKESMRMKQELLLETFNVFASDDDFQAKKEFVQ